VDPSGNSWIGTAGGALAAAGAIVLIESAVVIGTGGIGSMNPWVHVGAGAAGGAIGGWVKGIIDHDPNPYATAGEGAVAGAVGGPISGALPSGGVWARPLLRAIVRFFCESAKV